MCVRVSKDERQDGEKGQREARHYRSYACGDGDRVEDAVDDGVEESVVL